MAAQRLEWSDVSLMERPATRGTCDWAGEPDREVLAIRSTTYANGEPIDLSDDVPDLRICHDCFLALVSLHARVGIQVKARIRLDRHTYRFPTG